MGAEADIVIVNWNSGEWLQNCLKSIARFDEGVNQVIVVDNGSVDGSADADVPGLRHTLLRAGANLGFARACNLGAKSTEAPYLLFLNPDAALCEAALPRALAFMEDPRSAEIGICGIRLLDEDGATQRHCARFPIWRSHLGYALGLTGIWPGLFPTKVMEDFDHLESRDVDHVIGAFFLIRRSLFEALGGFDERFFVYNEDLDLGKRALDAGWRTHYLADAVAFHKGAGASEQVKARRLCYALQTRILYAFKHFSSPAAWGTLAITLLLEPVTRIVNAVVSLAWEDLRNTVSAYAMLTRDLPDLARKIRTLR